MEEYIIPALAMIVVAVIEALAAIERRKTAISKKREAEHEAAREEMMVLLIKSTRASIALGEAVAHAMQRGHTNGDTEKALDYALRIKQDQKDFLARQGIHAMWE